MHSTVARFVLGAGLGTGVSLHWPHGQKLVIEIFSHHMATA